MEMLQSVYRRDRAIVLAGLIVITGLAWAYLFYDAVHMTSAGCCAALAQPQLRSWSLVDLATLFMMWAIMMAGMMIPSASPMVLMFARFNRQRRQTDQPLVPTALFLAGYLIVWTGFSALATVAQCGLHAAALLSPQMSASSPWLGAALLLAAGIFQWTPLKNRCLRQCRSPMDFLMQGWREGCFGAVVMGLRHGIYCAGCCWFLMALLFVAGVMNLLWVAVITVFVLLEKAAPKGDWIARLGGALLVGWGLVVVAMGAR
jgi:predicted metal-binding membrane protein